jgi:uridylate kinase
MKRYLLKLSGEALIGKYEYGIDPDVVSEISSNIVEVSNTGNQLALVVGGGNIFRGAGLAEAGIDRVTGDNIGMLATVINSLALQDAIEKLGVQCRVMSAVRINQISEDYIRRRAIRHLEKNRIVIFAAGTGNPFFTTDTAASLRAIEINANMVLKATKVDGVYDKDPVKHKDAKLYKELTYNQVLNEELKVMDTTAVVLCKENKIPLRVFNMLKQGALMSIINGEDSGTIIK